MPPPRWLVALLFWPAAVAAAAGRYVEGRAEYADTAETPPEWRRPGGRFGHTHIDFGGQWLLGRTVASGEGRNLYDRNTLRGVARRGYPRDREPPAIRDQSFPSTLAPRDPAGEKARHDADALLDWSMGKDSPRWGDAGRAVALPFAAGHPLAAAALAGATRDRLTPELAAAVSAKAIGGPLYPPVHACLYAPLCLDDDPAAAYHRFQILTIAAAFAAGFAASALSGGRVPWSLATLVILVFPGSRSGLVLGQNPAVTLAVLLGGWALAARGRPIAGGAVWGLLAFKPVWGVAFILLPLVQRRWRFVGGTAASGLLLVAGTLPVVGVQGWLDWQAVGRMAADEYDTNKNWVELSRDLHGIPRRVLLDFDKPDAERHSPVAALQGWLLWGAVFAGTVGVGLWRGGRSPAGVGAGFVALGAWLTGYRFMYYDVLLAALPVAMLWADPRRMLRSSVGHLAGLPVGPRLLGVLLTPPVLVPLLLIVIELVLFPLRPRLTYETVAQKLTDPAMFGRPPRLVLELSYYQAWETLLLLWLWLWCGWRLAWRADGLTTPPPAS